MVAPLPAMVDLRLDEGGDLILSWTEAPGARSKTLRRDEIVRLQRLIDAVSLAEASGQSVVIVSTRTALSAALFGLLDGPERALVQRVTRAEVEGPSPALRAHLRRLALRRIPAP